MCCFSREVISVAQTRIFARTSHADSQFLVYSMHLSAKEDLAMILPLPVPKRPKEDAVRFIDLQDYSNFFEDVQRGFPRPRSAGKKKAKADARGADEAPLKVASVGAYDASFVPSIHDFERLDKRFRLPRDAFDKIPAYKDYGFAVFMLKPGDARVHPMAFEFPRSSRKHLFFPTVHIHDGKVHPTAMFDHALYCQESGDEQLRIHDWRESNEPAGSFVDIDKAKGIVAIAAHCHLLEIHGEHKNTDIFV